MVFTQQNVFRLDVSMEDTVPVHMVDGLYELIHIVLDPILRQVVSLSFDGIIHIHVHELKDQRQSTRWLITRQKW